MPSSAAKLSAVSCCRELTATTSTFSTSRRSLIVVREIQPVPAMPQRVRGSVMDACSLGLHDRSVDTRARLRRPREGLAVELEEAELVAEAEDPLEVVHQRPVQVAQ